MKLKIFSDYSSKSIDNFLRDKIEVNIIESQYCELNSCLYGNYTDINCVVISKSITVLFDSWLSGSSSKDIVEDLVLVINKFETENKIVISHTLPYIETTLNIFSPILQEFNIWIQEFNFHIVNSCNSNVKLMKVTHPIKINWEISDNFDFIYNSKFFDNFSDFIKLILSNVTPKKMVITDLDNTLWDGILGDDGIEGISISDRGKYAKFGRYLKILKLLKNRGVLLAISSKNDYDNVKNVFETDKIDLKLNDFVAVLANWNDKGNNIKELVDSLNIGMDSVIFVDDNKMEQDRVKSINPSIFVCDSSISNFPSNLFEMDSWINLPKKSTVDRTIDYRNNYERLKTKDTFTSIDEYLSSLKMSAKFELFNIKVQERIIELSLRSNQWNHTTIRMNPSDLGKYINSEKYFGFYVELLDKFGNMGIVSYLTILISNNDAIITNWVMSCRVLNRGLDDFMLQNLLIFLKSKNVVNLYGHYQSTLKNKLVADLYMVKYKFEMITPDNYYINLNKLNIYPSKIEL